MSNVIETSSSPNVLSPQSNSIPISIHHASILSSSSASSILECSKHLSVTSSTKNTTTEKRRRARSLSHPEPSNTLEEKLKIEAAKVASEKSPFKTYSLFFPKYKDPEQPFLIPTKDSIHDDTIQSSNSKSPVISISNPSSSSYSSSSSSYSSSSTKMLFTQVLSEPNLMESTKDKIEGDVVVNEIKLRNNNNQLPDIPETEETTETRRRSRSVPHLGEILSVLENTTTTSSSPTSSPILPPVEQHVPQKKSKFSSKSNDFPKEHTNNIPNVVSPRRTGPKSPRKAKPKKEEIEKEREKEREEREDLIIDKERSLLGGRYWIGAELGKGAVGRVFRGLNVQTGELVAIKQFQKVKIVSELEGVMRELDLMRLLFHDNIVNFYEYHETKDYLYYVLEFVEGGSLHNVMKQFGTLPESLLALYIGQILRGIQYLHYKGIIHRDIKGDNILLNKDGQCKLADFGSCNYQALGSKDGMVGSPFWMAPEIIEGREYSNPASDIWSVGCMVLELLTGRPPYFSSGPEVALYKMVTIPHPPIPPNVSPDLNDFLKCCFIKDVYRRPLSHQLLQHKWVTDAWPRGSPLQNYPPPSAVTPKIISSGTTTVHRLRKRDLKTIPMDTNPVRTTQKDIPLFFELKILQTDLEEKSKEKQEVVDQINQLKEQIFSEEESIKFLQNAIIEQSGKIRTREELTRKFQHIPDIDSMSEEEKEILIDEIEHIIHNSVKSKPSHPYSLSFVGRTTSSVAEGLIGWISPGTRCQVKWKSKKDSKQKDWCEGVIVSVDALVEIVVLGTGAIRRVKPSKIRPSSSEPENETPINPITLLSPNQYQNISPNTEPVFPPPLPHNQPAILPKVPKKSRTSNLLSPRKFN